MSLIDQKFCIYVPKVYKFIFKVQPYFLITSIHKAALALRFEFFKDVHISYLFQPKHSLLMGKVYSKQHSKISERKSC